MANRYWVNGGTGNWSSTTNWSATSGGASGASVPTTTDNVFFDGAGNSNCTVDINPSGDTRIGSLLITSAYTSNINILNTRGIRVVSNVELGANCTITSVGSGVLHIGFQGTTITCKTNGLIIDCNVRFGAEATNDNTTITLLDDFISNNNLSFQANSTSSQTIINGFSIKCRGNLFNNDVNRTTSGTSILLFESTQTQTLSGSGILALSIQVNKTGGTLTINSLTYFGTLTHIAGTVVGNSLTITGSSTLDIAPISWSQINFNTYTTITLVSDLVVNDLFINGANAINTINGFSISILGNLTINATATRILNGTTILNINGTGDQSYSNPTNAMVMSMTLNINKPSGILTITNIVVGTCTFTHIAGTVSHTGTLSFYGGSSPTFNTSGINWNNVTIGIGSQLGNTTTLTLTSTLNLLGNLTLAGLNNSTVFTVVGAGFFTSVGGTVIWSTGGGFTFNPANDMTVGNITVSTAGTLNSFTLLNQGNLTVGSGLTGTGKVILSGTGTWSGASLINMDMDIDTAGTITLSGASVIFGQQGSGVNPRFNYITGTINQGSTIFRMEEGRYDMSGVTWSNLITGTNGTIVTLLANINCVNFTPTSGCTLNGAFNFNVNGNLTPSSNPIQGTATIRMVGTGTLSGTGNIFNNLVFNTAGTITLSGTINYRNSTFTHTSGTVNSGTSTLTLGQATNFVINSTGFALNNLNPSTFNVTFSGTNGCTINNFSSGVITAGVTHTFQSLRTYNIATLNVVGTISSPATIRSSTSSSQAILTLTNASYNYVLNVTDINSGLGAAGFTSGGILTNATNWTTAAAALYYIGSTNYSGANLWSVISGGSPISAITAPTSSDPVIFDANSGNCIMNVAGVAGSVNFANYTNTITFSNNLSVSGNITLGSGMTFAGASRLQCTSAINSTLTSNGKEVGVVFEFIPTGGPHTITFADNWTFGENLILMGGGIGTTSMIYNGNNLLCKKSLLTDNIYSRAVYGTTKIQMIGSGIIGALGLRLNVGLDLEINTVGSYTIQNFTWGAFGGRTLKYTNGTVTHDTGTTLVLSIATNAQTNTLDLNGIDFQTIIAGGGVGSGYTLLSNLKCITLDIVTSPTNVILNNSTIYVTNYIGGNNSQSGTSIIYFNGWNGDGTFASGNFQLSATIDTPNTLTITDVTAQGGASITHIQGNIVHTGTLILQTCTFNFLPNVLFNILIKAGTGTTATFLSDITCKNLSSSGNVNTSIINTGYKLFVTENITFTNSTTQIGGLPNISFIGNGVITMGFSTSQLTGELEINTSGVVNLVGQLAFSGTFRHLKGTIISKGSTVILRTGATILGASRMNLDNVQIAGGGTITMDEFFSGTPQIPTKVISTTTANYTINFTDGFEKLAKNVKVSRCTISRRGQLLLLSKGGFGVNNLGIRYYNQLPNGVSTDTQRFVNNNLTGMPPLRTVNMLVGDPAFT